MSASSQGIVPIEQYGERLEEVRSAIVRPLVFPNLPIVWWRTRQPRTFSSGSHEARRLRQIIRTRELPDPDWIDAAQGAPLAAIAVAARQLRDRAIDCAEIDFALSAVLACAIDGDATCPIVISSALRRRTKIDPACSHLIDPWLHVRFESSKRGWGR